MILLKSEVRDDRTRVWDQHVRIKIFTKQGFHYGDVEIPFIPGRMDIEEIAARVVQPDGRATEFRGPYYEKTLAKYRRQRVMAKTFALPELRAGTIVEYRYRLKAHESHPLWGTWIAQEGLFVREARFEYRPDRDLVRVVPRGLPGNVDMLPDAKGVRRATIRDMPAFFEEPFSPPEQSLKMRFHVSFPTDFGSPLSYAGDRVNEFIGRTKDLRSAADEIVDPGASSEEQVRSLYEAVQGRIRNLSYEESYSKKERRKEHVKERKRAKDVWRYGYGNDDEIAMLFAGLCRAIGVSADPVIVVSREDKLWDAGIPLWEQLDAILVVADLAQGPVFLDPGTRFAPFGWLPWPYEGVPGVRLGEVVSEVNTPFQDTAANRRSRDITVRLDKDGSAIVGVVETLSGQSAFEYRTRLFELPEAERRRRIREDLEAALPSGTIEKIDWTGMDEALEEASISFEVRITFFAQRLGARLIVPASLFDRQSHFRVWRRRHPVYLPYSETRTTEFRLVLPPGYRVEHVPENEFLRVHFGVFGTEVEEKGGAVVLRTRIVTRVDRTPPDEYPNLKGFFDLFETTGKAHIVLLAE